MKTIIRKDFNDINKFCYDLEWAFRAEIFVTYREEIKWYVIKIKFSNDTYDIYIVSKETLKDKKKTKKRLEEIIEQVKKEMQKRKL